MKEVIEPNGIEPKKVLQVIIDKKIPVIMSYLSKDKWHVAKVLLTDLSGDSLKAESSSPNSQQRPINIKVNQPVGISFKYGYGKFVFDTTVEALEQSSSSKPGSGRGGTIVLAAPQRMELVQRRSYFRINVPESLKVKVLIWHRKGKRNQQVQSDNKVEEMYNCWQGRMMDISAGGAQVVITNENNTSESDFKNGQFAGIRFTPLPYETPIVLNTQIRNVLPTADGKGVSLGMQFVGLEASPEGRRLLSRLASVVERYYQINQSGAKQQDARPLPVTAQ